MKDLRAYQLRDGRVLLISNQGSTIKFTLENLPFDITISEIKSELRDLNSQLVGSFIVTKLANSIDFELPYQTTKNLVSLNEYTSDNNIIKNISNIIEGKYLFDIEVTENNIKYKIVNGVLVVNPEQTKS